MDELKYMSSERNSLEGVKEKYKKGVIDSFAYSNAYMRTNQESIKEDVRNRGLHGKEGMIQVWQTIFEHKQYEECMDNSLGSNDRWGIVSARNLFGLKAEIFPKEVYKQGEKLSKEKKLYLKANAGRFQPQKFALNLFPNFVNISDILAREEQERYTELETFYDMTNRQVFEKFGVSAETNQEKMLLANAVVLDSLLKDRYSEIKSIWCGRLTNAYNVQIEMNDGTKIIAGDPDYEKGILIEKEEKRAGVQFDAVDKVENRYALENISDLEVKNVTYFGDEELAETLKKAMAEQFKSQQEIMGIEEQATDEEYR